MGSLHVGERRRALIIVGPQRDFCEGGALSIEGGNAVIGLIADYVHDHVGDIALVVTTRDWHEGDSDNGGHFAAPGTAPDYRTTWPIHCVQGTLGADYAPAFVATLDLVDAEILQGQGNPGYSAFSGTTNDGRSLEQVLREADIDDVEVVGLATDYCVSATAIDAASTPGRAVTVVLDLCRGVNDPTTKTALSAMLAAGVTIRR